MNSRTAQPVLPAGQMRGSYSIKEVLPALVPDLSYDGLDVSDGMMAMRVYHEMCKSDGINSGDNSPGFGMVGKLY